MRSKRIKNLEMRVEELSAVTDLLILLVNEIIEKDNNKTNLDSGKWYKPTP
jgi:hypothetical protein